MRRSAVLTLLLVLLLGACAQAAPQDPPLKGARLGGAFSLTDQNGRRVTERSWPGKYKLVYFGYTFCPDVCPVDMRVLGAGLRRFEERDAQAGALVQPIFVSVDPARDTPPVLREFVANFHPRFVGLTGTPDELARMARAYGASYMRREGATPGSYLMDHTRNAVLYDPEGRPLAIIPYDQGPDGTANELARWVR
ncbi:MAG TPA: SCO family protein [Allosphingosinicella sp.]|nr:SCO family protein [Allosphingosinicella sp.]